MNPKVLFHHVAKTGGTSVLKYLQTDSGQRVAQVLTRSALIALDHFSNSDVVVGHFGGRVLFPEFPNVKTITLLRDPVELALSGYFYLNQTEHAMMHEFQAMIKNSTLMQYAEAIDANMLTRRFAAAGGYQASGATMLAMAKDNLARYDMVGFTDNIAGFIAQCCHRYGWGRPTGSFHERQSIRPDTIPEEVIATLHPRLSLDIELVAFARTLPSAAAVGETIPAFAPDARGLRIDFISLEGGKARQVSIRSGGSFSARFDIVSVAVRDRLNVSVTVRAGPTFIVARRLFLDFAEIQPHQNIPLEVTIALPLTAGQYEIDIAIGSAATDVVCVYAYAPRSIDVFVFNETVRSIGGFMAAEIAVTRPE